jgi:hypothetical protein
MTQNVTENGDWSFPIFYIRAPRAGLPSQRNDAVLHARQTWPAVQYVVFIDDDTELSPDALNGIQETFQDPEVLGVNIPFICDPYASSKFRRLAHKIFHSLLKAPGRGVVLPCCYFYLAPPEIRGAKVDWTVGCGMAFRVEVFSKLECFFPEAFQRFGGYGAYEDQAFSFHLQYILKRKLTNSVYGGQIHHRVPGGRLNVKNLFAARWFNIRLLFDDTYGIYIQSDGYLCYFSYCWRLCMLKTFYFIYFSWHALYDRGFDVFRGLWAASRALRHERKKVIGRLFEYKMGNDS